MENLITLSLSLFLSFYLYKNSFKLNSYFKNAKGHIFSFVSTLIFTFLMISIIFVFIDVMTTSTNKVFLNFKEKVALNFLFIFEVIIMIILPTVYINYLVKHTIEKENETNLATVNVNVNGKKSKVKFPDSKRYLAIFTVYSFTLVTIILYQIVSVFL